MICSSLNRDPLNVRPMSGRGLSPNLEETQGRQNLWPAHVAKLRTFSLKSALRTLT